MPNRVGANRASIVPGNSAASTLYLKLIGKQPGLQMPPAGPLSAGQINVIKAWIDEGADWPEGAGEAPPSAPDPQAARIMEALRNGESRLFTKMLRQDPKIVNRKGPGGSTPLMYAALYGDPDSVRLLLERGADPNLRNDGKATALMYAIDDPEKTRLLLEHGADANARSDEDQTPLLIAAAAHSGSIAVVKLLLDHGANGSLQDSTGRTALSTAAIAGDKELVKTLLDRGADRKPLPLALAARTGCSGCVDVLIQFADKDDLSSALSNAVRARNAQMIKMLLDRGASAGADLLPALVLSEEALPIDVVKALVDRGVGLNANTSVGGTILDLAKRQGETRLVDLLIGAGAKEGPASSRAAVKPKPASSVRAAIERSIPPLQRADVAFLKKSGCVSCHNNSLTAMAMAAARKKGLPVNEQIARGQLQQVASYLESNRERALQGLGVAGSWDTVGYVLLGMAAEGYTPNAITGVWARYLKNTQLLDGHWRTLGSKRPPLESSDIEVTAAAMRAIQVYGLKTKRDEYEKSVRLAVGWLESAQPVTTEDRVFQLLGLQWAGGSREVIRKTAGELIAAQRGDGGWSQLSTLASDAYATGQVLVALQEAGVLAVPSSAYQRGVQFLLNSQLEDGSWYVRTRTLPVQPYFDSEFPHDFDQFISAAATNWAVMAMAPAAQ